MDSIVRFAARIADLVLRGTPVEPTDSYLYLFVFGIGCAIIAELVLLLDTCVFNVRGESFLEYKHSSSRERLRAAVLMPIAAGIVGIILLALEIVQAGRPACITVGIAWPTLMTVVFGRTGQADTDDDPEVGELLGGPDEGKDVN